MTPGDPEGSVLCKRDLPIGCQEIGYLKPETPACKACLSAVASIVIVKRPDSNTGELIEELRAPDHFKPEKVELVSRDFRRRLLAGERPGLIWPGAEDCPVEPGAQIEVGSGVTIAVYRIRETKGGDHRGLYTVDDDRPALPRRTPQMFEPPETDEYGDPIRHTSESIAAATIDGNYTQDPKQAVSGVGPEVDVEYRRVLGVRKRKADMEKETDREARRKRERAIRDELRSTLKGLEPQAAAELLAEIERLCTEARDMSAAVV